MPENKSSISTIFFDVAGVVAYTNWNNIYTALADFFKIPPSIIVGYHKSNIQELLTGKIDSKKFLIKTREQTGVKHDFEQFWLKEATRLAGMNHELLNFIDNLRKENYSLAILSNVNELRIKIDEAMHLYDHFDEVFLSCREGVAKPDKAFYELALRKMNVQPQESLFIDDRLENVRAAQELQMNAILFTDNESLFPQLLALGIKKV